MAKQVKRHLFQPGETGNPNGRPKDPLRQALRTKATELLDKALTKISTDIDNFEPKELVPLASMLAPYVLAKLAPITEETGQTAITYRVVYEDESPLPANAEFEEIDEDGGTD